LIRADKDFCVKLVTLKECLLGGNPTYFILFLFSFALVEHLTLIVEIYFSMHCIEKRGFKSFLELRTENLT